MATFISLTPYLKRSDLALNAVTHTASPESLGRAQWAGPSTTREKWNKAWPDTAYLNSG